MLGRATRRCDEIGKETFRIFDSVDLYANLQKLTQMRPVVVNPSITLDQLFEEFVTIEAEEQRRSVLDQIIVKLRHRLHRLTQEGRQLYEANAGETPEDTLLRFQSASPAEAVRWLRAYDWLSDTERFSPIAGKWVPTQPDKITVDKFVDALKAAARLSDFVEPYSWVDGEATGRGRVHRDRAPGARSDCVADRHHDGADQ